MTQDTKDELMKLLTEAKGGNKQAEESLILGIKREYMNKRIFRFLGRNRQVENEDLKQEFMIGVALAISRCRLDLGDPIEFLVAQGVYKVRACLRSKVLTSTIQICGDCGYVSRLNRIGNEYICRKCGSTSIETHEVHEHDEITIENTEDKSLPIDEQVISEMMLEKFESTLTKGTNIKNLYTLLSNGINRDNPHIKNYIKEIAKIWGGCSEQNVVQVLTKLQNKLIKYADENGYVISGNRFVEKG